MTVEESTETPNSFEPNSSLAIEAIEPEINTATVQGNSPRLIMTRMILENFKSYAGRIEIGPFHKVLFSDYNWRLIDE